MKKKRPQKDSPLPSGIERYTIGTGFTKRARYRIKGPFRPEHLSFIEKLWGNASEDRNTLDALIAATEASARQILTEAGLPSEPRVFYTIPEGKRFISLEADEGTGTLLDLVVARGFQERKDLEWYAAQILNLAHCVREVSKGWPDNDWMPIFVKKGGGKDDPWRALSLAVELGGLISEAKAVGFFKNAGATKKPKRRLPPFRDLVRHLIRKNRKGTARDLWKIIPTDQIDGIRIKDYKFYRSGGQRLIALGKGQGYKDLRPVGRTLQFGAFKKRVGMVRKPTAR